MQDDESSDRPAWMPSPEQEMAGKIERGLRESQPNLYRQLRSTGRLSSYVQMKARETLAHAETLRHQGYNETEAESEAFREIGLAG